MKTKKLILYLFLAFTTFANAQFNWYGQLKYNPDSTILTTGTFVTQYSGFITGGARIVRSVRLGTQPDFAIIKTDAWGGFSSGTDFTNYYQILDAPSCFGSSAPQYNCNGIRIIEMQNWGQGETYAMAGIYNDGVFFATLDNQGNVINTRRWQFPFTLATEKVNICAADGGDTFYITGDFFGSGYVIRVSYNGTPLWANLYSPAGGGRLEPRAVIEENGNPGQIAVVGLCEFNTSPCPNYTGSDGMFMRLTSGGAFVDMKAYSMAGTGIDSDDALDCIAYSAQSGGYIVGGRSVGPTTPQTAHCCTAACSARPNTDAYPLWMALLDVSGNVQWSTLIKPSAQAPSIYLWEGVTGVAERLNPNNGNYEYYGAHNAMAVFKLDQNGGNSLTPNEFWYGAGSNAYMTTNPWGTSALTIMNSGGSDDGFQIYSPFYGIAKAYFNGTTGCYETITNIANVYAGPVIRTTGSATSVTLNSNCNNLFSLNMSSITLSTSILCQTTSVTGGSNAKAAGSVGVLSNKFEDSGIKVFPNPTQQYLNIDFSKTDFKINSIEIYDAIGQKVFIKLDVKEKGVVQINTKELKLANGIYSIRLVGDTKMITQKLVVESK